MDCLFCTFVKGDISVLKVYEDKSCLAFLDIKPHALGHTIIIPKSHAVTIFELDKNKLQELIVAVEKVMEKLQERLHPHGFNVGWNHNSAGGQVIPHLHIHIMPRYNGDGGGSIHSIIKNPGKKSVDEVYQLLK